MTKNVRLRGVIKQHERKAFWSIPEFVSVLFLLNCLRAKNMLKQVKFSKFSKVTAKPKDMEK